MADDQQYQYQTRARLTEILGNITKLSEHPSPLRFAVWHQTVIVCLMALFACLVLGSLVNMGFVSLMCRENFASKQKFTFWMNLAFVNVLLCTLWVPMKMVVIGQLFFKSMIDSDLVLAELNVYVLFMSSSFFSVVFITILKVCYLLEVKKRNTSSVVTFGLTVIWILSFIWMVLQNFIQGEVGVTYIMCKNMTGMLNFHEKVNNDSTEATVAVIIISSLGLALTFSLVTAWHRRYTKKVQYTDYTAKQKRRKFSQPTVSITIESVDDDEPTDVRRPSTCHSVLSKSDSAPPSAPPSARRSFVYFQDSTGQCQDTLGTPVEIHGPSGRRMSQMSHSLSCDRRLSQLSGADQMLLPMPGRLKHCPRYMDPGTYEYVTKWSVDVLALQNQLSNPTLTTQTMPFAERKRSNQDDLLSVRWSDYHTDFTSPRPSRADTGFHSLDSISMNELSSATRVEMETLGGSSSRNPSVSVSRRRSSVLQSPITTIKRNADKVEVRGCISLLVLSLVTSLPVLILNLFQWNLSEEHYFNLHMIFVSIGALEIIAQPLILIRMDRSVKTKVIKAQHRCHCYRQAPVTAT